MGWFISFLLHINYNFIPVNVFKFVLNDLYLLKACILSLMAFLCSVFLTSPLMVITNHELNINLAQGSFTTSCIQVRLYTLFSSSFYYLNLQGWGSKEMQLVYNFFCFVIQFLFPCVIVCFLYNGVSKSISFQPSPGLSSYCISRRILKIKLMNKKLLLFSLVFFISWSPLHIFNLILNLSDLIQVSQINPTNFVYAINFRLNHCISQKQSSWYFLHVTWLPWPLSLQILLCTAGSMETIKR